MKPKSQMKEVNRPMTDETDDFANVMESLVGLEQRIDEFDQRLADMETRLDRLEESTQLLQLVEDVDSMEPQQRSVALLQHMQRKIRSNGIDRIFLNRDDAEDALHHPDVHRTTIYSDMERCESLVGEEDVCWYVQEEDSPVGDAVIYLDLEAGELPATVTKHFHGGA